MTDIEQKALALVREVLAERNLSDKRAVRREVSPYTEALCRAIEQHEAFRQEVSDAVSKAIRFCKDGRPASAAGAIGAFVIPAPKPDPLVRIINEVIYAQPHGDIDEDRMAGDFRSALDAAGFEIREKGK